ncbi:MAG: ATP-binding cassette domain-containing protein, partial [Bacillota bacterium]|nr:ATP-binding cassette domain-containing protein [Bacillota bacterium]
MGTVVSPQPRLETINKGEKVLILGPSGSGKSTLANCINGLNPFSYDGVITGSCK